MFVACSVSKPFQDETKVICTYNRALLLRLLISLNYLVRDLAEKPAKWMASELYAELIKIYSASLMSGKTKTLLTKYSLEFNGFCNVYTYTIFKFFAFSFCKKNNFNILIKKIDWLLWIQRGQYPMVPISSDTLFTN